ncbi:PREDICTED: uncharacterized protein LOC105557854 isoform X2 [Vollenhovia emeryi]|nr:PREDICTED: uncharacterized protein LOC105557854 isoform X2 [Vollenhovia emeryi]
MNQLKEKTTHVVVQFMVDTQSSSGSKKSIDLVPRTWLTRCTNKWMCYFPEKKDWPKVDRWARILKSVEKDWKLWEVVILKEAANYDQGKRRLEKAYMNLTVETSTAEDTDKEEKDTGIVILGKDDSLAELNNIPLHVPVLKSNY